MSCSIVLKFSVDRVTIIMGFIVFCCVVPVVSDVECLAACSQCPAFEL